MGNFFPFEVGAVTLEEVMQDGDFVRVREVDAPDWLEVYVDKTLVHDLNDPMVIDYAEAGEIQFPFVLMSPNMVTGLEFYSDPKCGGEKHG